MTPRTMYFAEFIGANGKPRYVGEGATMPFDKESAKLFETKAEARAALARVHPAHRSGTFGRIGSRKVIVSYPLAFGGLRP